MRSVNFLVAFSRYAWFRSGPLILWCAASFMVAAVSLHEFPQAPIGAQIMAYGFLLFVTMALVTTLTFSDPVEIGQCAFPRQLFLHPASSSALALAPLFFGSAVVGLLAACFSIGVLVPSVGFSHSWWPIAYLMGSLALFQALSWSTFPHPILRVLGGLFPAAVMLVGPVLLLSTIVAPWQIGVGYALLYPLSIALAIRGVSQARCGEGQGSWEPKARVREEAPFSSPLDAQVWLEVKRNGMVGSLINVVFVVVFGSAVAYAIPGGAAIELGGKSICEPAIIGSTAVLSVALLITSFTGCCASLSDNLTKNGELQPFLALRPLSTAQLIEAKMRMARVVLLRNAGISLIVVLVLLLIPSTANLGRPTLLVLSQALTGEQVCLGLLAYAAALVGAYKGMISGIWSGIGWLPPFVKYLVGVVPILIGLLGLGGPAYLYTNPQYIPRLVAAVPVLVGTLMLVKLVLTSVVIKKLTGSRLVSGTLIAKWSAAWLLVGIALAASLATFHGLVGVSVTAVVASQFLLLPFARVGLAPILVRANRHR
jgi:hypothetical protein